MVLIRIFSRKFQFILTLFIVFSSAVTSFAQEAYEEVIRHQSDGSWIADTAAVLGPTGAQAAMQYGTSLNSHVLYNAFSNNSSSAEYHTNSNYLYTPKRGVSSAKNAPFAVMERLVQNGTPYNIHLKVYSPLGARWERQFSEYPLPNNTYPFESSISDDGERIALVFKESGASNARVFVFNNSSSQAINGSGYLVSLFGSPRKIAILKGGSGYHLAIMSDYNFKTVNLSNGTISFSLTNFSAGGGTFSTVATDGADRFAVCNYSSSASPSRVFVIKRSGDSFATEFDLPQSTNAFCKAIDIRDGVLAVGSGITGSHNTFVNFSRLVGGSAILLSERHFPGDVVLQNSISKLKLFDKGNSAALGFWGGNPNDTSIPQLVVLDTNTGESIYETGALGGSVLDLDATSDGKRIAVATKGVHSNIFGGGGAFRVFESSENDLIIKGEPKPGGSLTVTVKTTEPVARLYVGTPNQNSTTGFYVVPQGMTVLGPVPTQNGQATFTLPIPSSTQVGTVLAIQGAGSRREITKAWEYVTVLNY